MKWATKLLISFCMVFILGVSGFIFGYNISNNRDKINVTSSMILERITDKYFIVTKTLLIDETVKIVIDKGGDWSNLLWGQTINASAVVSVDVGVDLSKLNENNISIDESDRVVSVVVPHAEVLNTNIYGTLNVDSQDGILKTIFNDTTNTDYNRAMQIMKDQASEKVLTNTEMMKEAEQDSLKLLEMILDNMGYELELNVERVS